MKEFYAEIDDQLKEYENGTITISEDIDFSMRQTVRQITHYTMSKYMNKQTDEQGRRKPFRNIGNAIVDLEWRSQRSGVDFLSLLAGGEFQKVLPGFIRRTSGCHV